MRYPRHMLPGSLAGVGTRIALGWALAALLCASSGAAQNTVDSDAARDGIPRTGETSREIAHEPGSPRPTADPEAPGGELDARGAPAPPYGSRAAIGQSEPAAMRRVGQPDAVDPELPTALSFFTSLGAVMPSSYDDAIVTNGFGRSSPSILVDGSITHAIARWLHVGGRVGARGRGWIRRDGEFALASGVDLLALASARVHLGPVIELGLTLGGGVGLAGLSVRQRTLLGVSPRLHGALQFGLRLARGFHLSIRGAWDYFPWNDIDRYGSDLDLGGPSLGIGFEVKT